MPGGTWLFNDITGHGFLSRQDSLYVWENGASPNLVHICGKIDSLYLGVVHTYTYPESFKYYLIDMSSAPQVDTNRVLITDFSEWGRPGKIQELFPGFVIVHFLQAYDLRLFKFSNDSMRFVKQVLNDTLNNWRIVGQQLIGRKRGKIYQYEFNPVDSTFSGGTIIGEHPGSALRGNLKFSWTIKNDSLHLYRSWPLEQINAWDISAISLPTRSYSLAFVDSPFVYLHQQTRATAIVETDVHAPQDFSVRAYPNPFNGRVQIAIRAPINTKGDIRIFDVVGRDVQRIDFRQGTEIERISWQPQNLAGGVY